MPSYNVAIMEGDGIGPEVVHAAARVLKATGVPIDFTWVPGGEKAHRECGSSIPEDTVQAIRQMKVAFKGPMLGRSSLPGYVNPNREFRKKLGLYAAIKRAKSFGDRMSPFGKVDIAIVREIQEDAYCGAEQMIGDGAVALKFVTRAETERVADFAVRYSLERGCPVVATAGKITALKLTDGLFCSVARERFDRCPGVDLEYYQIDNLAYQMARDPRRFGIILVSNVYGDILADLAAGLAGSIGLGFGGNFSDDVAMFEPVHGAAPKYTGLGVVNPGGAILSGAMLLEHLGEADAAKAVFAAVENAVVAGEVTKDLGGSCSTGEMADAVIRFLK